MNPHPSLGIRTLTLNPALDETWTLDRLADREVNMARSVSRRAGGKGVNVTRVLQAFSIRAAAVLPVGGPTGQILRDLLSGEDLAVDLIPVAGETRRNLTLRVPGVAEYKLNQEGTALTAAETEQVLRRAESGHPDILAVCGRMPPGADRPALVHWLAGLREKGIRAVLDTTAFGMKELVELRPWMVKVNAEEFAFLTGAAYDPDTVTYEALAAEMAGFAERTGARTVVTLGRRGVLELDEDGTARHAAALEVPGVTDVGAGDAMLAGMLAAWAGHGDGLRWGTAAAAAIRECADGGVPRARMNELYQQTAAPTVVLPR